MIPVVNDFSVVQNTPLCAGFQCNDVEAVAFCIGIIKVIPGHFSMVIINFGSVIKCYMAILVVDAATQVLQWRNITIAGDTSCFIVFCNKAGF